ncbi:fimbrillin family protein [Segatella copri]|uniref:fimbrillin family protein n=1 Tax=Segatella copri TaxID=165179 RepID=UPI00294ACB0A|nr:fimbrillin family protein [Segatella copri]
MKKVIFGTALASMALLSACSSDNELANVETAANNAIGFHVVGNKAETRATIVDNSNITGTKFNVFAFTEDGKTFMGDADGREGINISFSGEAKSGKWDYTNQSDLRYWPTTPLNFYAVNPGITTGENGKEIDISDFCFWEIKNTTQQITYLCSDDHAAGLKHTNIDVMYAIAKGQTQETNSGKVKFKFKHILSQIAFKAKTQDADFVVDIASIKLHNTINANVFTFPANAETEPTQSNWAKTAVAPTGAITIGMNETKNITSAGIDVFTKPTLFIPQTLTAWTPSTKTRQEADNATPKQSYLEISCKIKHKDFYIFGNETTYSTLFVPFSADWQPGKRYVYTLIFGGGYNEQGQAILKPINFEAETTKWVDDINNNGNDINIDK